MYSEEEEKKKKSIEVIRENEKKDILISVQVLNEFVNILKKKFQKEPEDIRNALDEIESFFIIWDLNIDLIKDALRINERYRYSYYDSLIISTALDAGCSLLYSEDMQHKQRIDNALTILNPFRNSQEK